MSGLSRISIINLSPFAESALSMAVKSLEVWIILCTGWRRSVRPSQKAITQPSVAPTKTVTVPITIPRPKPNCDEDETCPKVSTTAGMKRTVASAKTIASKTEAMAPESWIFSSAGFMSNSSTPATESAARHRHNNHHQHFGALGHGLRCVAGLCAIVADPFAYAWG